ncbi:MAG: hypothetical protein M3539_07405, partial [Acidobacteriota bacterium]|nr:hypothetical protein [Acidobacteriota bacterium]
VTNSERSLCCRRRRARAFIALDTRLLTVLAGGRCLSFFKADLDVIQVICGPTSRRAQLRR